MSYTHKRPKDAHALLTSPDGWIYLDVRSAEEYASGHPTGAWNIPVMNRGPMGMTPNAEFVAVASKVLPKTSKLVVGCASGMRSLRACDLLAATGYTTLVNCEGGFQGGRDDVGNAIPGWAASGLPVETQLAAERTYAHLRQAKG